MKNDDNSFKLKFDPGWMQKDPSGMIYLSLVQMYSYIEFLSTEGKVKFDNNIPTLFLWQGTPVLVRGNKRKSNLPEINKLMLSELLNDICQFYSQQPVPSRRKR